MSMPENTPEYLDIHFDKPGRILELAWIGEIDEEQMRRGYEKVIALITPLPPKKCVIDMTRRQLNLTSGTTDITNNIFGRLLQIVKEDLFVALILPPETYFTTIGDSHHEKLTVGENQHVLIRHFLNKPEAETWLATVS